MRESLTTAHIDGPASTRPKTGRPHNPTKPGPAPKIGRGGPQPTAAQLAQLQRMAGNQAVAAFMAEATGRTRTDDTDIAPTLAAQRCSGPDCDCASGSDETEQDGHDAAVQRVDTDSPTLQGDFVGDAWKSVSEAGPAVANATRLVAQVVTNPSMAPMVLTAIAWEELPEAMKGPIIDKVLRACLTAAKTVEIPNLTPGVPVSTIMQNLVIGALERALTYPASMKVRAADRIAKIVLNPSPEFSLGFFKGLVVGLWDGLTGPFVLLWDLVKIAWEIEKARMNFVAKLANAKAREAMSKDVQDTLDKIQPRVKKAVDDLMAGKTDPRAILNMIDQLVAAALKGIQALGGSLSDSLLQFMNRPDKELGEGVGWVAGTATFEVLLLVLTEGGYTALKEAVSGLRIVIRAVEAGAAAWEALGPVRAALSGFRKLAAGNRALAPLVEAIEETILLLVKFLKMSYGLEGGAGRAGEKATGAGERGAAREVRVADTAMGETHEITLLADGRVIRCSDKCTAIAENVAERGANLVKQGMPEESARLVKEANEITADAKKIKANKSLTAEQREAQETALMRRAESLERQTAAAEREALNRVPRPARYQLAKCNQIAKANEAVPAMRQFDVQLAQLNADVKATVPLLEDADPAMRELAKSELVGLEKRGADLEAEMRKVAPNVPSAAPAAGAAFDLAAYERRIAHLPINERIPAIYEEAERRAAAQGWERDQRVGAINNREIYRDPKNGHYYSVDTQHGTFEHCDAQGNHITEVKMDGTTAVPGSQDNNHSIRI